jgi:acyl-CoA synthetase (AMP-forming)/AMP-acid ligase II
MNVRLTQAIQRACQIRGGSVAVVDGEVTLTWRALADRITRLAGALRSLGLRDTDRVALLTSNTHRALESYFATIWSGGVIVPLNHRLSPGELAAQVKDFEPSLLISGPEFASLAREITTKPIIHAGAGRAPDAMQSYEDLIAASPAIPELADGADDVACLFYTGGTTAEPKGVMLSHNNIMANTLNFIGHIGMDERTVHLHCGPLFHVAAGVRLFSVTQAAGTHVMLPRFAVPEVLEAISRHQVTLATFVPTMLRSILDYPAFGDFDLSTLTHITYGAAPMAEALLREALARLPNVRFVQSYGMTETSPIATMLGWREHLEPAGAKLRSAGRAALLADIRIVDPSDRPLPVGERGEVTVRGPMVMRGYWRQPEATQAAVRDGWMHTGDIGYLDEEGYLFIVDRLKDVIISGGENVYSQEVENAIAQHPGVKECAVFGRPDRKWGESVHAVVVARKGMKLDSQMIIEHCRTLIAAFKCPKSVDVRSEPLPLSGANKILKKKLREELLQRVGDPYVT